MEKPQMKEPIDLIKLCLEQNVIVKLRGGRLLEGKLNAFDAHLNIILTDVTETYEDNVCLSI